MFSHVAKISVNIILGRKQFQVCISEKKKNHLFLSTIYTRKGSRLKGINLIIILRFLRKRIDQNFLGINTSDNVRLQVTDQAGGSYLPYRTELIITQVFSTSSSQRSTTFSLSTTLL